jgi:hypothetical protein
MRPDERAVLERAVRRVTEQAANVNAVVDEAMASGVDGSSPLVVNMKMIRAELLSVKGDLERELEREILDCVVCGSQRITSAASAYGPGIGATPSRHRTRHRNLLGGPWCRYTFQLAPSATARAPSQPSA